MSAYTTLYLTPEKAREVIIRAAVSTADSELLERLASIVLEGRLYDCRITWDESSSDDHMV